MTEIKPPFAPDTKDNERNQHQKPFVFLCEFFVTNWNHRRKPTRGNCEKEQKWWV